MITLDGVASARASSTSFQATRACELVHTGSATERVGLHQGQVRRELLMRRRDFIGVLSWTGAWSLPFSGQQLKRVPRIGFLGLGSPAAHVRFLNAFRRGLRDHGYIEPETILVEYRWADGRYERLHELANELTRENVDLVVTYGSEGALAAKRTITTLPVVAVAVDDMVGAGVVANFARPEANVTGLSLLGTEVSEKRLSLLRDTIPELGKVAILWNPGNASMALQFKAVEAAARRMGIEILNCHYSSVAEFADAIAVADHAGAEALFTADDAILIAHAIEMIELARKYRLPIVSEFREIAEAGGLWSYGPNLRDIYRRAAIFVDKLLKRAKPRDLPVEQPTRFEFVINLQTARVLGRELPPALLAHADEVIA
jgi:putative tryptophan/tyrosine transport system substrate-binding protein